MHFMLYAFQHEPFHSMCALNSVALANPPVQPLRAPTICGGAVQRRAAVCGMHIRGRPAVQQRFDTPGVPARCRQVERGVAVRTLGVWQPSRLR